MVRCSSRPTSEAAICTPFSAKLKRPYPTRGERTSREEALEWTKRFPNPAVDGKEGEIEVRQLSELEDFEPGAAIERFGELTVGTKQTNVERLRILSISLPVVRLVK